MQRLSYLARQAANVSLKQHATRTVASSSSESAAFQSIIPPPSESQTKRTRRPRIKSSALEVTPAAEKQIVDLLSQKEPRPAGVRIGLRTRGCNGMAYVLNYADQPSKFDEKVAIQNGHVHVYIDPRALMHIVGTKMDFVDNDLVSEFVFHNPNAKGTCGCGESFNV